MQDDRSPSSSSSGRRPREPSFLAEARARQERARALAEEELERERKALRRAQRSSQATAVLPPRRGPGWPVKIAAGVVLLAGATGAGIVAVGGGRSGAEEAARAEGREPRAEASPTPPAGRDVDGASNAQPEPSASVGGTDGGRAPGPTPSAGPPPDEPGGAPPDAGSLDALDGPLRSDTRDFDAEDAALAERERGLEERIRSRVAGWLEKRRSDGVPPGDVFWEVLSPVAREGLGPREEFVERVLDGGAQDLIGERPSLVRARIERVRLFQDFALVEASVQWSGSERGSFDSVWVRYGDAFYLKTELDQGPDSLRTSALEAERVKREEGR